MSSYKLVVCPTDLTPGSESALADAAAIAVATGAFLLVLHVQAAGPAAAERRVVRLVAESLERSVPEVVRARLDWKGAVTHGESPAEAISHESAVRAADLIVMRSRRRPTTAAVYGSTAEAVSRIAPCPVLVTHPFGRSSLAAPDGSLEARRILVAYDFWDDSEIALQQALGFAHQTHAEVHLLHVTPPLSPDVPELGWSAQSTQSMLHRQELRLQRAAAQAMSSGIVVVSHVRIGHPYREILGLAESESIDMICMGARGRDFGARSLFGSNTDRVLRQAPCPMLIARPLKPAVPAAAMELGANTVSTASGGASPPREGLRSATLRPVP